MSDYWKVNNPAEARVEWAGATVTAVTVKFTSLNVTTGAKEYLQADGSTWAAGSNSFTALADGSDWYYKFVDVPASFQGREIDWEFTPTSVSTLPKLGDCAYVTAFTVDDLQTILATSDVEFEPVQPV